jgi:serine/threonine protein kinase
MRLQKKHDTMDSLKAMESFIEILDGEVLKDALSRGLISEQDVETAEHSREAGLAENIPYTLTQWLLFLNILSGRDIERLLGERGYLYYECPSCSSPLNRAQLSESGRECEACKATLPDYSPEDLETFQLSSLEILTARTLEQLRVSLNPKGNPFKRYSVLGELGRGGYGTVFRVKDRLLDRIQALKVFRAHDRSSNHLARFSREGEFMARLRHQYIVNVYEIGRHGDVLFIAMEEIQGQLFKEYLKDPNRDLDEGLDIFGTVIEATQFAHETGVLHRDLKPSNVLIPDGTREGRLFDFGLAKDEAFGDSITLQGEIVGTAFYTSPDQILLGAAKVDARSDIFSLGVMLYEVLTGNRPFSASKRTELYTQIMHRAPDRPIDVNPKISIELNDVCLRALHKERRSRHQSARELLEELQAARAAPTRSSSRGKEMGGAKKKRKRKGTRILARRTPHGRVKKTQNVAKVNDNGMLRRRNVRTRRSSSDESGVLKGIIMFIVILAAILLGFVFLPNAHGDDAKPISPKVNKLGKKNALYPQLDAEDWIQRAFFINTIAQEKNDLKAVVGLRTALHDAHLLVRGFAIRALKNRPIDALRDFGGPQLFEGLIFNLKSREPYLVNSAKELLKKMAGDKGPAGKPNKGAWHSWWKAKGKKLFAGVEVKVETEDKESEPPFIKPKAPKQDAPGSNEAVEKRGKKVGTRTRKNETRAPPPENVVTFVTEIRERGLEVVFVVDITKSMTDELAKVREQVQELTGFFMHLLPQKTRLGMVTYDNDVVHVVRLTSRLPAFARFVGHLNIHTNPKNQTFCEGVDKGLAKALSRRDLGWLQKTFKTIVILGDAPPHLVDRPKSILLAKQAVMADILVNAIIAKPPKAIAGAEPIGPINDITKAGQGLSVELSSPEELITQMLTLSFGPKYEKDLRRFVDAYREVTARKAKK